MPLPLPLEGAAKLGLAVAGLAGVGTGCALAAGRGPRALEGGRAGRGPAGGATRVGTELNAVVAR